MVCWSVVRDLCAKRDLDLLLVLNKVDRVKPKKKLLPMTDILVQALTSENYKGPLETHYISAIASSPSPSQLNKSGTFDDGGLQKLKESILRMAKPGEWYYDEDEITDMTDEKIVTELVRDQLFKTYQKEVPYRIVQQTMVWEEKKSASHHGKSIMVIEQALYVPSESMKRIVQGRHGSVLRKVKHASEKRISDFFNCRVKLSLNVKIAKGAG